MIIVLGRWLRFRMASTKRPSTVDHTSVFVLEKIEKPPRKVETTVGAAWTLFFFSIKPEINQPLSNNMHKTDTCLVHDLGLCRLAVVCDGNHLKAVLSTCKLLANRTDFQ
jgi:hypothetical protein